MEIYLIRHGIATPRQANGDDEQRPLQEKGRIKTTKVAECLLAKGLMFDLILTSPLKRALQTADILNQAGLTQSVISFPPLKPGGEINQWLEWITQRQIQWQIQGQTQNSKSRLALVGHQPDLSNWAEMLLWGTVKSQILLKKAGIIGIIFPDIGTPIARSSLFLLASPKWIL